MIPKIQIKKIMSKEIVAIEYDANLKRASELMRQEEIGSLLVKRGTEYTGIITEVDTVRKALAEGKDLGKTRVEEVMSAPLITIDEDETITTAQDRMARHEVRHLVVTVEGRPVGMVSARDILYMEYPGEEGIPFWPDHALKEIIAALLVMGFLFTLTILSPAPMEPKADSFTTPEHIKPEWYFLASYQALKVAEVLKFLGAWAPKVIGIMGQGIILLIIILLPFLDRNPERRPGKRPIAISLGILMAIAFIVFTIWGYYS